MPVKIVDVTALSWTNAGLDRGSNQGKLRLPENVNAGTATL
jgi:hypothetical protein